MLFASKLAATLALAATLVAATPTPVANTPNTPEARGWAAIERRAMQPNLQKLAKRRQNGKIYPLPNGFPNPNPAALKQIEIDAQGGLPGGALPKQLTDDDVASMQLVAFNELFEVAFFNSLLYNVTHGVKGYTDFGGQKKEYVVKTLKTVVAQEEIHALGANAFLKTAGHKMIEACNNYQFPVNTWGQALGLADLFTSLVLGTLQDISAKFAAEKAAGPVGLIGSVIGQEGQQDGYFRYTQGLVPSANPFLTAATREYAFSALQGFAHECPSLPDIKIRILKPLTVLHAPEETTKPDSTSVVLAAPEKDGSKPLYVTYINQQYLPITVAAQPDHSHGDEHAGKGMRIFDADFPYAKNQLIGLTIVSVGYGKGPFANAGEATKDAVYGPGLVVINPTNV